MESRPTADEDRAASWALRLDRGPLAPGEERELKAFLDEDPGHEAMLREFEDIQVGLRDELPALQAQESARAGARRHRPRHAAAWFGAGLAAAAGIAVAAVLYSKLPARLSTHVAQREEIRLADGTHLALNARTRVDVSVRGKERRVRLESGEAYFDVARDSSRPFIVSTPAGSVRVTGTRFNVRSDDADPLEVTVLDGSVSVVTDGPGRALVRGDQLSFNGVSTDVRRLASPDDSILWREGRVVFDGVPLRVAVARFASYHGVEITVAPGVETLRLGGVFKLDDLDEFLRSIAATLPISVLPQPSTGGYRIVAR